MTGTTDLARRFGTPSYVYDLDRVAAARDELFAALPDEVAVYYAAKANPHPEILREMRAGGPRVCRAEISSVGELDAALRAGFEGTEILYTGPGKTTEELAEAMTRGVRTFSVESPGDLRHVGGTAVSLGITADCLIRVNNPTGAAATSIRMTGVPSQFGFDGETLPGLAAELRDVPGTTLVGLHFFPLSNAKDEASLIAEFQHTIATAAALQRDLGRRLPHRRPRRRLRRTVRGPGAAAGLRRTARSPGHLARRALPRLARGRPAHRVRVGTVSGRRQRKPAHECRQRQGQPGHPLRRPRRRDQHLRRHVRSRPHPAGLHRAARVRRNRRNPGPARRPAVHTRRPARAPSRWPTRPPATC